MVFAESRVIRIVQLDEQTTEYSLKQLIQNYVWLEGNVESVYIRKDEDLALIFAYVIFQFSNDAQRTLEKLNGLFFNSSTLSVDLVGPNLPCKTYKGNTNYSSDVDASNRGIRGGIAHYRSLVSNTPMTPKTNNSEQLPERLFRHRYEFLDPRRRYLPSEKNKSTQINDTPGTCTNSDSSNLNQTHILRSQNRRIAPYMAQTASTASLQPKAPTFLSTSNRNTNSISNEMSRSRVSAVPPQVPPRVPQAVLSNTYRDQNLNSKASTTVQNVINRNISTNPTSSLNVQTPRSSIHPALSTIPSRTLTTTHVVVTSTKSAFTSSALAPPALNRHTTVNHQATQRLNINTGNQNSSSSSSNTLSSGNMSRSTSNLTPPQRAQQSIDSVLKSNNVRVKKQDKCVIS